MAKKKKTKKATLSKSRVPGKVAVETGDPWEDDQQFERKDPSGDFTAGEMGLPDEDAKPDGNNPKGVQGGRGPPDKEGEGNRQDDEAAELEQDMVSEKDLNQRR